jgi:hypothetical protein
MIRSVRISLIGLPLAAICLTGLAAACSGPHRAGSAAPVPSPSVSASTGTFAAEGILAGPVTVTSGHRTEADVLCQLK